MSRCGEVQGQRSFRSRLLSGGFWALAGKSLSACGSFAVFLIISRALGTDEISTFVCCESAALLGTIIATAGLHSVIVRTLRKAKGGGMNSGLVSFGLRILGIYLAMFFITVLCATIVCFLPQARSATGISEHLVAVSLWVLLLGLNQIVSEFLRGFENFRDAATMGGQNLGILTLGILIPILLICSAAEMLSLRIVFVSQILSMAVTLVFGALRLHHTVKGHIGTDVLMGQSSKIDSGVVAIFSEGMPNLLTQMTTLGITQSEVLILGQISSGPEIAVYAGIKRLVQLTGAPLLMINGALPTFIADLVFQKNMGRLETILRGSATVCFVPLLAVSLVFIACPKWTIDVFFNAEYLVGARCLQILSVGNIAAVASGSCGLLLMMSGNQRYAMLSGTIAAIVFVTLAPGLTSVFGMAGMALGVAVSTIVRSIASATFARNRVGIWSVPTFSRTALLSGLRLVRMDKE